MPTETSVQRRVSTDAVLAGPGSSFASRWISISGTAIGSRHYGHLARDGREHAIRLLDALNASELERWTLVDAPWTPTLATDVHRDNGNSG
jgi:hypothetical protein